jgi:uncharacterized membrane protein
MKMRDPKSVARNVLGSALVVAGLSHLTFARKEFQAQVPDWVPLPKDDTVVLSGVVEVALGASLLMAGKQTAQHRKGIGRVAAAFFVAVFPGNWSQYSHGRDAFGLNSDRKRFARLFFQPLLVGWALKST